MAFNVDGAPTKAAEGFARTQGVSMDDIFTLSTDKGDYIAVKKHVGGAKTIDILSEVAPAIIMALPFPKRMKWGSGEATYARPLRFIVALLDRPLYLLKWLALPLLVKLWPPHPRHWAFCHTSAAEYLSVVEEKCAITLDPAKRRSAIIEGGNKLGAAANGSIIWKDSLLDEEGLVEHPVLCLGDIVPYFLGFP